MIGKKIWAVGDGFLNHTKNGGYESHESLCVLNLSGAPARMEISIYFKDREPLKGFKVMCENERAEHIRLDWLENEQGEKIPHDVPYALLLESDQPVVVQYSRMDVSQPEMTLMTTIAYS